MAGRLAAWAERDRAYKLRRRVWRHYTWRAIMAPHLVPLLTGVSAARTAGTA